MTYVTSFLADDYYTAPNKNLVNFPDLNQILRSEIFLHKDGQLRAVHIILGYEPISKCFQSPKNIIRAKDLRLALIDVAVRGFLLTDPPSAGTQDAQLLAPLVTKHLYSQEPPMPSNDEVTKCTPKPTQEVIDKDFEAFYHQEDLEDLPSPSQ